MLAATLVNAKEDILLARFGFGAVFLQPWVSEVSALE